MLIIIFSPQLLPISLSQSIKTWCHAIENLQSWLWIANYPVWI